MRLTRATICLKWLAAAALVLLVGGFVMFVSRVVSLPDAALHKADGIVVLTGDAERIGVAVHLLAEHRADRLLISGVNPKTTRNALQQVVPRTFLLFECCIDIGYDARDTAGNAKETRDWVQRNRFRSLIVVTSDYHMPRSLIELARAMPDVTLIPAAARSRHFASAHWWTNPDAVRVLLAEYVKLLPATARLAASRVFEDQRAFAAEKPAPVRASTL